MRRMLAILLVGIAIGAAVTALSVDLAGGWYLYEVWPEARCHAGNGIVTGVPEPVPGSAHPCLFRRPRWSFIN